MSAGLKETGIKAGILYLLSVQRTQRPQTAKNIQKYFMFPPTDHGTDHSAEGAIRLPSQDLFQAAAARLGPRWIVPRVFYRLGGAVQFQALLTGSTRQQKPTTSTHPAHAQKPWTFRSLLVLRPRPYSILSFSLKFQRYLRILQVQGKTKRSFISNFRGYFCPMRIFLERWSVYSGV